MEAVIASTERAKQLIGFTLARAKELGLGERQIAALNALYWSSGAPAGEANSTSDLASILSADQFRDAVSGFLKIPETASDEPVANPEKLDALIANALDTRFKDKSVVEVQLAAAVADRLIGWSKVFGAFVAVPIAAILLILSLFGWSKFDDVRRAAKDADDVLKQAQTKLADTVAAESKVDDLVNQANQRAAALEQSLASLKKQTETNAQQIAQAQSKIQHIQTQLGDVSAQRETGNQPPGSILGSRVAGKLYGPWAFLTRTAGEFVSDPDFPWREDFNGLAPGGPEFDAAWSKLGSQEPDRFREAQRSFGQKKFFEPAAKLLATQCGLDVGSRSRTLQEIVFALSIRSGPAVPPIVSACKTG
jgi:hypothetical protein